MFFAEKINPAAGSSCRPSIDIVAIGGDASFALYAFLPQQGPHQHLPLPAVPIEPPNAPLLTIDNESEDSVVISGGVASWDPGTREISIAEAELCEVANPQSAPAAPCSRPEVVRITISDMPVGLMCNDGQLSADDLYDNLCVRAVPHEHYPCYEDGGSSPH